MISESLAQRGRPSRAASIARIARIACIACIACICGTPMRVSAEELPREQATRLIREGNELLRSRRPREALGRYLEARAIYHSARLDYNIALAYDRLGRAAEAATFYTRFLGQSDAPENAKMAAAAEARMDALRLQVGSLSVRCPIDGAEVFVDGQLVGRTPLLDERVYRAPGARVITIRHALHPTLALTIQLVGGAHSDIVVPWQINVAPSPAPVARKARTPIAPRGVDETKTDDRAAARHRKTIWAHASLAVGLGLAAAAAVFYGVGVAQGQKAYDAYWKAGDEKQYLAMDTHYSNVESAKTKLIVADVLAGAAAAALIVSICEFATRPSLQAVQRAPRRATMQLFLAPGQTGLGLSAPF